jgi:hypothetical protein
MQYEKINRYKRKNPLKIRFRKNIFNNKRIKRNYKNIGKEKRSEKANDLHFFAGSIPSVNISIKSKDIPEWIDKNLFLGKAKSSEVLIDKILFFYPDIEIDENNWIESLNTTDEFINSCFNEVRFSNNVFQAKSEEIYFDNNLQYFQADLNLFDKEWKNDIVIILISDLISVISSPFINTEYYQNMIDDMLVREEEEHEEEDYTNYWSELTIECEKIESKTIDFIKRQEISGISLFKDIDWLISFFHSENYFKTSETLHKKRDIIAMLFELKNDDHDGYFSFWPGIVLSNNKDLLSMIYDDVDDSDFPSYIISYDAKNVSELTSTVIHSYFKNAISSINESLYYDYRQKINSDKSNNNISG